MNDRRELPLADYDHLPEGSLQHRIRSLEAEELQQLLDYEVAHANRPSVVQLLAARQDQLAEGATPSSGTGEERPEQSEGSPGGSRVDPNAAAEPGQPLRHGLADQTPNRGRR